MEMDPLSPGPPMTHPPSHPIGQLHPGPEKTEIVRRAPSPACLNDAITLHDQDRRARARAAPTRPAMALTHIRFVCVSLRFSIGILIGGTCLKFVPCIPSGFVPSVLSGFVPSEFCTFRVCTFSRKLRLQLPFVGP